MYSNMYTLKLQHNPSIYTITHLFSPDYRRYDKNALNNRELWKVREIECVFECSGNHKQHKYALKSFIVFSQRTSIYHEDLAFAKQKNRWFLSHIFITMENVRKTIIIHVRLEMCQCIWNVINLFSMFCFDAQRQTFVVNLIRNRIAVSMDIIFLTHIFHSETIRSEFNGIL